jgi:hypothetical protein
MQYYHARLEHDHSNASSNGYDLSTAVSLVKGQLFNKEALQFPHKMRTI